MLLYCLLIFRKVSAELVLKGDETMSKDLHYIVYLHTTSFKDYFMMNLCPETARSLCITYVNSTMQSQLTVNCENLIVF